VKSGNAKVLQQVEESREGIRSDVYPMQWEDADFEPIKIAIESILRSLGWM
jgi:hypothetical protein